MSTTRDLSSYASRYFSPLSTLHPPPGWRLGARWTRVGDGLLWPPVFPLVYPLTPPFCTRHEPGTGDVNAGNKVSEPRFYGEMQTTGKKRIASCGCYQLLVRESCGRGSRRPGLWASNTREGRGHSDWSSLPERVTDAHPPNPPQASCDARILLFYLKQSCRRGAMQTETSSFETHVQWLESLLLAATVSYKDDFELYGCSSTLNLLKYRFKALALP